MWENKVRYVCKKIEENKVIVYLVLKMGFEYGFLWMRMNQFNDFN